MQWTDSGSFNRLAWSVPLDKYSRGILAAGMETGEINVYDPAKILAGSRYVMQSPALRPKLNWGQVETTQEYSRVISTPDLCAA